MKVPLELLFIVFLLAVGWSQPYRHHLERILGREAKPSPAARSALTRRIPARPDPTPVRDNSWLWQPGRLDSKAH